MIGARTTLGGLIWLALFLLFVGWAFHVTADFQRHALDNGGGEVQTSTVSR